MEQQRNNQRTPCFKIQFQGVDIAKGIIQGKLQTVSGHLTKIRSNYVTNSDILNAVLDFWIQKNGKLQTVSGHLTKINSNYVTNSDILNAVLDFWIQKNDEPIQEPPSSYQSSRVNETNQDLFIIATKSLQNIVDMTHHHSRYCKGAPKIKKMVRRCHVLVVTLKCSNQEDFHTYSWSSTPYLPNKKYLVNHRICHAIVCCGMLPVHYTRFSNTAEIGCISKEKEKRKTFHESHKQSVDHVYNESIEGALMEEIGMYEEHTGIDIMTDAWHGWRKNAKGTSVVAIGDKTHIVLQCQHVMIADDPVSQRHEMKGTSEIYRYFEAKDTSINVYTHDRNMAVNKFVKTSGYTLNQNDSWHGVRSMKKAIKSISSGPKYKEGKTLFEQLYDKEEPVATHVHWALRNCDQNPQTLQSQLSKVVNHYKNELSDCHSTSRCKLDPNYEPFRHVITNPKAEKNVEDHN